MGRVLCLAILFAAGVCAQDAATDPDTAADNQNEATDTQDTATDTQKAATAQAVATEQALGQALRDIGARVWFDKAGRLQEINANGRPITDAHLARLAGCDALTDLSLEGTLISAKGLAHLRGLKKLEWLNLFRTRVGDEGLKHVATLPALQHLPVGDSGVTDAGLKHLAGMRQLVYLGLRGNAVTDRGGAHLRGLINLRQCHLGETRIADLSICDGMPRLEKLWITDLEIPDKALRAFRQRHPGCEIVP